MKVILINGSPKEKGCTYTALREIERQLQKNNIETEIFWLGNKPISVNRHSACSVKLIKSRKGN